MSAIDELKLLMQNQPERVVIGSNRTLKLLKLSKVDKVYIAKNAPEDILNDIKYYAKLANVEVIPLSLSNEELGAILKKPFKVAVVSVLK